MRVHVRVMAEAIAEKLKIRPDIVLQVLEEYGERTVHGIMQHDMQIDLPSIGYLHKQKGVYGTRIKLKSTENFNEQDKED